MGKKSQAETDGENASADPNPQVTAEINTGQGATQISEVESTRRRIAALARDLNPLEIVTTLDMKGLSCRGPNDTLTDRLVRAELRKAFGDDAAEWDPEEDEQDGLPNTRAGWQNEPSLDEIVEGIRTTRLNNSQTLTRQSMLPTGQSMGPYNDPISIRRDESGYGEQYLQTPSGIAPTPNRAPHVTFADGHRLSSSPVLPNYRANSTRILENANRRQLDQQLPHSNPSFPQFPPNTTYQITSQTPTRAENNNLTNNAASSWFKDTTFNIPGSQIVRNMNRLNPFETPNDCRISDRVVKVGNKIGERGIKFAGRVQDNGAEYLRQLYEAIRQYGLTEEETMQVIPFTLDSNALGWFRAESSSFRGYAGFLEQFRSRFLGANSQAKLWGNIKARTQGTGEPIAEYVTHMQVMFLHLDEEVPMNTQMDIIYKNLHPKFTMWINPMTLNGYQEFIEQGQLVEAKMHVAAQYAPPPPPEKMMLPDTAWSRNNNRKAWGVSSTELRNEITITEVDAEVKNVKPCKAEKKNKLLAIDNKSTRTFSTQTEQTQTPLTPHVSMVICYNCGQPGHISRVCPAPRRPRVQFNPNGQDPQNDRYGNRNYNNYNNNNYNMNRDDNYGRGCNQNQENLDCIGAAYDELSSASLERINVNQLIKMLGKEYNDNRKFATVQLGEKKFRALIDTGATRTFVGPIIGELINEYIVDVGGIMKVADGSKVELLGCAILKLTSNQRDCTLPVRVCSALSYDMVLGMDFIAAMGVEFRGDCCTWNGGKGRIDSRDSLVYIYPIRTKEQLMSVDNHAERMRKTFKESILPEPRILSRTENPPPLRRPQRNIPRKTYQSTPIIPPLSLSPGPDEEKLVASRVAEILAERIEVSESRLSYSAAVQNYSERAPRQSRMRPRYPESVNAVRKNQAEATVTPVNSYPPPLMSLIVPKPLNYPAECEVPRRSRYGSSPTVVPNMRLYDKDRCWRCGRSGHPHRACDAPRKWRYCYLCGRKDVDVTTCPQCKESWRQNQLDSKRERDRNEYPADCKFAE